MKLIKCDMNFFKYVLWLIGAMCLIQAPCLQFIWLERANMALRVLITQEIYKSIVIQCGIWSYSLVYKRLIKLKYLIGTDNFNGKLGKWTFVDESRIFSKMCTLLQNADLILSLFSIITQLLITYIMYKILIS